MPTTVVLAWTVHEKWPTTKAKRLARLERVTAMQVAAIRLTTPKPGVFRAHSLQLKNVETGEVVLTSERATLDQRQVIPRIRLEGAKLSPTELPLAGSLVQRTLEVDWPEPLRIEVVKPVWLGKTPDAATDFFGEQNLMLVLKNDLTKKSALDRRWILQLGSQGPRLEIVRNRQVIPPATRLFLDTRGQSIPARWLTALGAVIVDGGEQAQFAGTATITKTQSDSSGDIVGRLEKVSLAKALKLPLDSTATIRHMKVAWSGRRIDSAEGLLETGSGKMDGRLARTLQYLYREEQPGALRVGNELLEYGTLKAWFLLDDQSLRLAGAADESERPACVLGRDGTVLFGFPDSVMTLSDLSTILTYHGTESAGDVVAALPVERKH